MEYLESNKANLCNWLSVKAQYIIDKCEDFFTFKQGKDILKQKTDADKIIMLLNTIIEMGNARCEEFYEILKKEQQHFPGLQQHFSESTRVPTVYADDGSNVDCPQVKHLQIKKDMNISVNVQARGVNQPGINSSQQPQKADMVATKNSHIFAPVVSNCTIDGNFNMNLTHAAAPKAPHYPDSKNPKLTPTTFFIPDKRAFLKRNCSELVSRVKNVKPIVDYLQSRGYHDEMAANVHAQLTPQGMMRKLLESATSTRRAEDLIQALFIHQNDVMEDLGANED
ncbi:hypothetical protein UPYG_G00159060 [Umbra pygmaea]|uniref:CARD domain-containing protein n=1 Tax=Umbra pygmaea TaxID=75934 RepID=A0ABD0XJE4_UMBPY